MSDMTDVEKLRVLSEWFDVQDAKEGSVGKREVQVDLLAIANLLDAMRWRDEPPDTVGDWVRWDKDPNCMRVFRVAASWLESTGNLYGIHRDGDRWIKLPEDLAKASAGSETPQGVQPGQSDSCEVHPPTSA